jgi:hypothetical protein
MAIVFEELDHPYILHHSKLNQPGFSPLSRPISARMAIVSLAAMGAASKSVRATPLPEKP